MIHVPVRLVKDPEAYQEAPLGSSVSVHELQEIYRTPQVLPPSHTISNERRSPTRALTINDLPHAELLSQAFMQFMYSMSTIFRDPKYEPLIHSLDQQFGHGVAAEEPHSAPPTLPTEAVEREHSVTRCSTHPGVLSQSEKHDNELNYIMKM